MTPILRYIDSAALDRRLIYSGAALHSFAYGFASVLLGVYLDALGFSTFRVGALLSAALAGGALLTLAVSLLADRLGRKRSLISMALITALGGVVFALGPVYGVLVAFALTGAISPTGKDRGAFTAVEQSILPQTGTPAERNWIFARYSIIGSVAGALGALAIGTTSLLQRAAGVDQVDSFRMMFVVYAAVSFLVALTYAALSRRVEPDTVAPRRSLLPRVRSKGIIGGLAGLFALDSFGGGLVVQSFLSYWFVVQFDLSPETLGTIFFVSGLLTSLSYLVAARLASRIGLINTMVFTHLPSNVLLILIPIAPNMWGALAFFLAREALSQMDVPTRQSYTMAVVLPEERVTAAGVTTLSRNVSQSVSPSLGGYLAQTVSLSSPFLLGGLLKIIYDVSLYFSFRRTRPPDEVLAGQVE